MPPEPRSTHLQIAALCGSLRGVSVHRAILTAASSLLPSVEIYEGLGALPAFNPDLEGRPDEPASVREFRAFLSRADAVLFASPEYAHGIPGVLKNALDWVVGSGELSGKPVAVLNASASSFHAWEALKEVLRTMDARVIEEASLRLSLPTNRMDAAAILADSAVCGRLQSALSSLATAAGSGHNVLPP